MIHQFIKHFILSIASHPCLSSIVCHRGNDVIVLRPKSFLEHSSHFVFSFADPPSPASRSQVTERPFSCWQVPRHLQAVHWSRLLRNHWSDLEEQLVMPEPDCRVLSVLSKFEEPQFIHLFSLCPTEDDHDIDISESDAQPNGKKLLWHLPRFNLR